MARGRRGDGRKLEVRSAAWRWGGFNFQVYKKKGLTRCSKQHDETQTKSDGWFVVYRDERTNEDEMKPGLLEERWHWVAGIPRALTNGEWAYCNDLIDIHYYCFRGVPSSKFQVPATVQTDGNEEQLTESRNSSKHPCPLSLLYHRAHKKSIEIAWVY